jgi:CheY-like chemotaxis protein
MAASPARRTILVVEDDETTREALQGFLEGEGYPVIAVANGREAINYLLRDDLPCLILLDLMMPVMNGWEFRKEQKRDPAFASIPVVVCSAAGNIEKEVALLGAAGCLQKPIDTGKLLATVQSFCS